MFASTYFWTLTETEYLITSIFGLTHQGPFHFHSYNGNGVATTNAAIRTGKVYHI